MEDNIFYIGKANYHNKKEWNQRYPKGSGGYKVEGAIGKGLKKKRGSIYIGEQGQTYFELPKRLFFYSVKRYLIIEKDTYIVELRRRIPAMLIGLISILILILLGLQMTKEGPEIDAGAGKYKPDIKVSDLAEPGNIVLPGYHDIRMKAGTDTAYIALWNPDENPCYFKFTIINKNTKGIIYESKLIPPGYAVTEIKLKEIMQEGITPVIILIDTYQIEDYTMKMNGGEVVTNIIALKTAK